MGLLGGEEDHKANQIKEYESLREEKSKELSELAGAGDTPMVEQRRLELQAEITQLNINIEQVADQAQQERGQGYDLFED